MNQIMVGFRAPRESAAGGEDVTLSVRMTLESVSVPRGTKFRLSVATRVNSHASSWSPLWSGEVIGGEPAKLYRNVLTDLPAGAEVRINYENLGERPERFMAVLAGTELVS